VKALFPSDLRATTGWLHIAVSDENVASIAEWFAGSTALGFVIAQRNGLTSAVVPRGTTVRIPTEILLPPFRDAEAISDEEPVKLEYGPRREGKVSRSNRLRRKEALYSAVVVRFTGRLHAPMSSNWHSRSRDAPASKTSMPFRSGFP